MRFSSRNVTLGAGFCVIAVCVFMFLRVFQLASESGAVFAPYSTFRADPVGMMALYNAVDGLPATRTERFMQDFDALPEGSGATLLIAGAGLGMDPVDVLTSLEKFLNDGGRVVIAFAPLESDYSLDALRDDMRARDRSPKLKSEDAESETDEAEDATEPDRDTSADVDEHQKPPTDAPDLNAPDRDAVDGASGDEASDDEEKDDEVEGQELDFSVPVEDVSERWDFDYGFDRSGRKTSLLRLDDALSVEETVDGRSGLYFTEVNEAWKPILGRKHNPGEAPEIAVMERGFGAGSIVLCSDAYFLSNAALRGSRASGLIAWAIGESDHIYFSETHLGTQQQDRLMTLVRRYRLHGVLFGLVLVAVLFVWRHSATLIPRRENKRTALPSTLAERSHQDGLDNLLARFIPMRQLLDTCVAEWVQQFHNSARAEAVQRRFENFKQDPSRAKNAAALVAAFNEIADEIHRK